MMKFSGAILKHLSTALQVKECLVSAPNVTNVDFVSNVIELLLLIVL